MNIKEKMKVALIKPPLTGHEQRGIGIYTDNLYAELKSIINLTVDLVDITSDLSKYDLIHYPYFDPFFLTLQIIRNCKIIVTVHDLIPIKFPKYFPKGIKGTIKWEIQKHALKKANAIITDSIYSKKQIIDLISYPENQIHIIPLGLRKEFRGQIQPIESKVKSNYHLPDKFMLYVGDVNYNKNISGLISAFAEKAHRVKNLKLVLVGKGFTAESNQLDKILSLIDDLGINDKVVRLSDLSTRELVVLYRLAKVYVQPSYAEGFGLTVLEALSSGCPVISSDKGSLPEIGGDAVLYFNPWRKNSLSQKLSRLLQDKDLQKKLRIKGLERVKKFTWKKCAEQTFQVYQKSFQNIN